MIIFLLLIVTIFINIVLLVFKMQLFSQLRIKKLQLIILSLIFTLLFINQFLNFVDIFFTLILIFINILVLILI